jgi:two-component system sensor histidine kinase FlrB
VDNQNLHSDKKSFQHLQLAFEQFNRLSASLCSSVDDLNQTANHLVRPTSPGDPIVKNSGNRQLAFRLRALIDAIPGSVVVLDPQGMIVEFNSTALELLGEPLQQQSWREIVQRMFLSNLDQGELKTEDGRQFSISTKPLGYEPGQILLLSDVTQTRQLQRAAQRNLHLMTMGKMMASLAHQIRTPLASSMLYLSQIVESGLDAETSLSFSEKALARIKHIEKMINDMLVFAHGGNFNMSQFSITELLADLEEQLQPQIDRRQAKLEITGLKLSGPNNDLQLHGNRDALLGALCNLCMNALDANETSPRIQITVSLSGRGLLSVKIDDNGFGMERYTREHLFDPFYTTKIDGTGLGLAVVKSVIESHQGSITLASRPGKGSRFRILLPCQQAVKTQISHKNR